MLREISPAKLMIVLILVPADGKISNRVTTGPSFTFTTCISILKSANTFSKSSELCSIFSSFFLLLLIGSLVSSMSKEGVEKFFKFLSFESVF